MAFLYAALFALAAFFGTGAAGRAAELATYYHVGAWDAFSGRNNDGRLVCGIGTTNPTDGRRFMLRFTIGEAGVVFTVSKPTWRIPENTQAAIVMQVGLERPWTEQATGSGQALNWRLDRGPMQDFDAQFRRATSLTLAFPDGSEPSMVVSLAGSTSASEAFRRCIADFSAINQPPPPAGQQTQGPTQPFGPADTSPQPTQTAPTQTAPAQTAPTQPAATQAAPTR